MKKVGEVLAEARKKRQLSIDEIAKRTKIRKDFLEQMEENNFSSLPPVTYVKGFLKVFAQEVGLDEQTTLALFRRDFKTNTQGEIIPREFLKPLSRKRQFFTPKLGTLISISSVLLVVVTYVIWQIWLFLQPPELELIAPVEDQQVSKNVLVSGKTEIDAVVFVNSNPVGLNPQGEFQTEVFFADKGKHTVTIEAKDRREKSTIIQRTVEVTE